jgi:hypothetical protein
MFLATVCSVVKCVDWVETMFESSIFDIVPMFPCTNVPM